MTEAEQHFTTRADGTPTAPGRYVDVDHVGGPLERELPQHVVAPKRARQREDVVVHVIFRELARYADEESLYLNQHH